MALRPAVVLGTNLVLGTAALAWVLHRYGQPAIGLLTARPSTLLLLAFACTVAAAFTAFALRWGLLLAGLGERCALPRLLAFRAAGQSVSALIPSGKLGGEPLRAWLLLRERVEAASAIASVVVDRTIEVGAGAPFACLFAALLVRRGVPALEGALVTVLLGAGAILLGIALMVRRLRSGRGLVTAVARSTGLDSLRIVQGRMEILGSAEDRAARLVAQPRRLARAFGLALAVNVLVLVEYTFLLAAFGLPVAPLTVVGAVFAAGAAHSLPVPAGVGVLEGAQMLVFGSLGHPPEVGLAVGLAVRLRELVWLLPGLLYLTGRGIAGGSLGAR